MTSPLLQPYRYSGDEPDAPPAGYHFWCPGCEEFHGFRLRREPGQDEDDIWTFDGDLAHPTFKPSLRVLGGPGGATSCHLNLTKGMLHFHGDSPHALAGEVMALEPEPPAAG